MGNLFTKPHRLPLIAPSILSADFAHMGKDCAGVLGSWEGTNSDDPTHADLLHIDVMDGHFVPNLTMGPALVAKLRKALPDAFLDVHVMVNDPQQYIAPFADAGTDHFTFHIEPVLDQSSGSGLSPLSQGYDPIKLADECRKAGMTAGIAINPPTPAESIFDVLDAFDLALVMSVNPGFSGQAFIGEVLTKTRAIADRLRPDQRLQMDGGIGPDNTKMIKEAGCDVLVAASAIFGQTPTERPDAIRRIREG